MLFTSYSFIAFLAVLFLTYYVIPKKYQWMLLLAASYLFYGLASVKYLGYIIFTTVTTYLISRKLDTLYKAQAIYLTDNKELPKEEKKAYKNSIKSQQWKWLLGCLILNFGMLAVVKYTNFAIANVNFIAQAMGSTHQLSFWNLVLPMGISFYIFKSMSYIIDVYRGKYSAENNLFKLALYVSFFPQIIQGPISRFNDLSVTLFSGHDFCSKNFHFGMQRILWGFFKKIVIADRLLVGVNTLTQDTNTYTGVFVFIAMISYAFLLYADFTGGIDITIGIAQVLGIKTMENFDRPYLSKSIVEYWRRWHISMGAWFKDYVFYPLSVSKPMIALSKSSRKRFGDAIGKRLPLYITTMTVWFTTGLWHGASWNFIVWGMLNGFFIILSIEFKSVAEWFHNKFNVKDKIAFQSFQVVRTFLLMSSIRMLDVYKDVSLTFKMFGSMFTTFNYGELFNGSLMNLGLTMADYVILAVAFSILIIVSYQKREGNSIRAKLAEKPMMIRVMVDYALILLILIFGTYGFDYDSSQFIYNQF